MNDVTITMPRLSDSMLEGTILTWLKRDGDHVEQGEDLVEIETDKATMTHQADASGTLSISAQEGTTLPVGAPIARLGAAAENPPATIPGRPAPSVNEVTDAATAERESNGAEPSEVPVGVVKTTPLARRFAAAHGVPLAGISGSGPGGRVTRADVAASAGIRTPSPIALRRGVTAPPAAVIPAPPLPESDEAGTDTSQVVKLSRVQQVIADRMAEAKATIPEFQIQTEVNMDAAIGLRDQLKQLGGETVPSFNDLIVKAAAIALRAHPRANASYREGSVAIHPRINIGIAVAAEDALFVATVADADTRSLGSIAAETRRLAGRVRQGTITPPELSGGTFTVSNLGMYGMTAIAPVINPPQAAILGVGSMRGTPAILNGELVERQTLTLTLACDHRVLYGADAAQCLAQIREHLERPLALIL
jgi:pyruvate dehydrogenase E2 component (dihydrolipoamide acetyltransferase)